MLAPFIPSSALPRVAALRAAVRAGARPADAAAALAEGVRAIRAASGLAPDGAVEQWIWDGDEEEAPMDAFERRYVHTWLESVIRWAASEPALADVGDECAAHLGLLAGEAAAGTRMHRFFFCLAGAPRTPADAAVRVDLRQVALTDDALGARTWGAATVLALRLLGTRIPASVLELGAGTGLVGLALAAHAPHAHVVLTDYHPHVLANLSYNAAASAAAARVAVRALDWRAAAAGHGLGTRFALIAAADCVYEREHAELVAQTAAAHLAFPERDVRPQLHLCMAVRATHRAEAAEIVRVFRDAPVTVRAGERTWALAMVADARARGTENFAPVALRSTRARARDTEFWHVVVEWRQPSGHE